jgi:hypothetical protein
VAVKATDSQISMKSMESKTKNIIPEEDNTKAREELIAKDK